MIHKAGFVSIIGKPNVGKSTLLNALLGQKLSIVTHKAQTTRHRIRGILNGDDYQIVFSDTPGIIKPAYLLHEKMMGYVEESVTDADIILFITEAGDELKQGQEFVDKLINTTASIFVLINKIDKSSQEMVERCIELWKNKLNPKVIIPVSATEKFNTDKLVELIVEYLPGHPPYFEKDQVADRTERFFVSEIIREKILLYYKEEIPYSVEVSVEAFTEETEITKIHAVITVGRETQKGILIGHKGVALKKIGTLARKDMEIFLQKKVYLELFVKVRDDWRNSDKSLRDFGYS